MKLSGRRESSNVDDRRRSGLSSAGIGSMGIGGVIVVALITWMMGGNPLDALQMVTQSQMANVTTQTSNGQEFTEEEEELAKFSRQILAGTEDVWKEVFKEMGREYEPPRMVLYTRKRTNRLRRRTSCYGTVLLFCRPVPIH